MQVIKGLSRYLIAPFKKKNVPNVAAILQGSNSSKASFDNTIDNMREDYFKKQKREKEEYATKLECYRSRSAMQRTAENNCMELESYCIKQRAKGQC